MIDYNLGATANPLQDKNGEIAPYVVLNKSISCDELMHCLDNAIDAAKLCQSEEVRDTVDPVNLDMAQYDETDRISSSSNSQTHVSSTDTTWPGVKRNSSMTVVSNLALENNNSWEKAEAVSSSTRRSSNSFIGVKRGDFIQEVSSRSKPTLALNTTLRSQSPSPSIYQSVNGSAPIPCTAAISGIASVAKGNTVKRVSEMDAL